MVTYEQEDMTMYIAVRGQDKGTCEALRWDALSIAPFIIARGEDEDDVLDRAIERAGHDDVYVKEIR